MSKEEKAKEYAKVACLDIVRHYNVFTKEEISKFTTTDYLAGYTAAEQDLSSQLTAYKEALRELWSDIHFTDISKEQIMDRIGSLIQPKP